MKSVHLSILVEQDCVAIDPLTLYLRLVVLVDWKPETEIEDCFYYELTPYSLSIFKGGVMRAGKSKSMPKNLLLEEVCPSVLTVKW